MVIAAVTGMRQAEICALKWNNVDLENKIIYVINQLQKSDDTNELEHVNLKTLN